MRACSRAGFTIIEILIGVTILAVVFLAVTLAMRSAMSLLNNTSTSGSLAERSLRAVESVAFEVRWAEGDALLVTQENGAARLDFRIPSGWVAGAPVWSSTITYRVEPSLVDADDDGVLDDLRLVRMQDGVTRLITDYVTPGGFTAARTQDNLQIGVSLAETDDHTRQLVTSDANTSISLRN